MRAKRMRIGYKKCQNTGLYCLALVYLQIGLMMGLMIG
jgi:hypothetical protein